MSGFRTGANSVSPTAKMPNVVTKRTAAKPGVLIKNARTPHDSTQIRPTATSSDAELERAVHRTTTICSATMTRQLTAAAVPMVCSGRSRNIRAKAGSPDSNCA